MYKFLMYWAAYTVVLFVGAILLYKASGIDASSMAENAPVLAGIMALAITRKRETF